MAPVASSLTIALAVLGSIGVDAKPLTPGRHAPPRLAGLIASSKRSLHSLYARYYGSAHGLTKPPPLPNKRDLSLPGGWSYYGCISESLDERLLQGFAFSSLSLDTLNCVTECSKRGFTLAGTEYGDECYCASHYTGNGGARNDNSACSMPCASGEGTCGNAWLLSLYAYNITGLATCAPVSPDEQGNNSTLPISSNSTMPIDTNSTMPVDGNSTTVIGGSTTVLPSYTASMNATATMSMSASVKPSPSRAVYENPTDESEWYSLGCAVDTPERVLSGYAEYGWGNATIDGCLSLCEDQGFKYAGLEFGEECHCGDSLPDTLAYTNGSCTFPCRGDSNEMCGGEWRMDLYELFSSSNCDDAPSNSSSSDPVLIAHPMPTSNVTSTGTVATGPSATTTMAAVGTSIAASSAAVVPSVGASPVSSAAPQPTNNVPASSDTHYVWAHHMVGNTYPYQISDWANDISKANSYGIDGFALNMGSDWWQPLRIADAYTAAAQSGTDFKLFLSLDMTVMPCGSWVNADALVALVAQFANHPNQAMMNGKVLVSTFAGSDCTFGTGSMDGWEGAFVQQLSNLGVDIFFVPSIFTDPSTFQNNEWMDGELNWNSAWPMGPEDISTATDIQYMNGLGSKEYMAAVSPFFFTHFGADSWNKNWIYRSDDWLYATRWEQLIGMRGQIKALEILTWNDYGESSYIGPIEGALPAGSNVWVDGFDHEGINVLTQYYSTAFKTGSYPAIEQDSIVMWQRPHPKAAVASNDPVGRPANWQWTDDNLYAVVLTTGPATVTLTSGSNTQTFSVQGGLSKLLIPSSPGSMSGSIARDGSTSASYTSPGSVYTDNPVTYNFNYFIGSSS